MLSLCPTLLTTYCLITTVALRPAAEMTIQCNLIVIIVVTLGMTAQSSVLAIEMRSIVIVTHEVTVRGAIIKLVKILEMMVAGQCVVTLVLPAFHQPIKDFLECLLSVDDPLHDIPAKFWDLNTSNSASLNLAASLVCIEPKEFFDGTTHSTRRFSCKQRLTLGLSC